MYPRILCVALIAALTGCGSEAKPISKSISRQAGWKTEDLVGWKYTYESDTELSHTRFEPDGIAALTILPKDRKTPPASPDDPPPAPIIPLVDWSIEANGELLISASHRWTLVSLDDSSAKVLINRRQITLMRSRLDSH